MQFDRAKANPQSVFASPNDVLGVDAFSNDEKIAILLRWEYDAKEGAVALEEGMPGQETGILRQVHLALAELGWRPETENIGPTKQHGIGRASA